MYSRSTSGAKITLWKNKDNMKDVELMPPGDGSSSLYCTDIVKDESGPAKFQVKAASSNSSDYFLVHVEVLPSTSR